MLPRTKGAHSPRYAPRIPSNGLRSGQGQLVDMSSSGMRLHFDAASDMAVGDVRPFIIASPAQRIKLKGRVVWVKRNGLFTKAHDVGVQFIEVPPKLATSIESFAANGFMPTGEKTGEAAPVGGNQPKQQAQKTKPEPPPETSVDIGVPDLYAMLKVPTNADADAIRDSYYTLAKDLHPDRNPGPTAAAEFANLSKAYKVLADPEARARYDAMLKQHYSSQPKPDTSAA